MKLQGFGVEDPGSLQSQNCQRAKNRLSLNGLDFVHGQQNTACSLQNHHGIFSMHNAAEG